MDGMNGVGGGTGVITCFYYYKQDAFTQQRDLFAGKAAIISMRPFVYFTAGLAPAPQRAQAEQMPSFHWVVRVDA